LYGTSEQARLTSQSIAFRPVEDCEPFLRPADPAEKALSENLRKRPETPLSDELQLPKVLEAVSEHAKRAPRFNVMLMAAVQHAHRTGPATHRVRDLATHGARTDKAEKLRLI
jgi:hypothetical protein